MRRSEIGSFAGGNRGSVPSVPRDAWERLPHGASLPGPQSARILYDGRGGELLPKAIWGVLLQVITLGIYRFWFLTRLRRWLWGHTSLAGTRFEYLGRGLELLIGFLIALVVAIPIYALFFVAQFAGQYAPWVFLAGVLAIGFFGQFAIYRARRYRMSRTAWRGIRFRQTGGGIAYAILAALWLIPVVLTLGLALPFMRAGLERYRVNNSWFGDLQADSRASGWSLFLRWLILWLLVFAPFAYGAYTLVQNAAGQDLGNLLIIDQAGGTMPSVRLSPNAPPGFARAIVFATAATAWLFVGGFLLWPIYRAREFRAFVGAARLGEVAFESDLSAWTYYKIFILYAIISTFALGLFGAIVGLAFYAVVQSTSGQADSLQSLLLFVGVPVYILGISLAVAFYVVLITQRLWRALTTSITVSNLYALERVTARNDRVSGFGEGLADAFDVGGF